MKHNPANNPVWKDIADSMKLMLRSANAKIGVLLLADQNGAVAAVLEGDEIMTDRERLEKVLREFEQRMKEMADHVSGEIDLTNDHQCFIRDSDTGSYTEVEFPSNNN